MVAYKAHQLPGFLKSPGPKIRAALFYGPEAEQVADHADTLARKLADGGDAEIVRLGQRELAEEPGRLAVEAQTLSMFSRTKIIRASAGAGFPVDAVEELLAGSPGAWLIIDSGNLKPAAKLRKIFESSPAAAALPCYEISDDDMGRFIDAEFAACKVILEPQARAYLVMLFGGNQARARAEIATLALYAGESGSISLTDIDAVIGDVAQAAFNTLCAETGNRNAAAALRQLDRLVAAGQGAQGAIVALGRHFDQLHRLCAAIERGEKATSVLARFRPPPHFRQRDALQAQSRQWSRKRVESALGMVAKAAQAARRRPELEVSFTERLVLALSR